MALNNKKILRNNYHPLMYGSNPWWWFPPISWIIMLIRWTFGWCGLHGWFMYPKRYRRNTMYLEESENYSRGCKECQKEDYEMMQELWDDYNSSRF